jgi:DinB superfamily
MNYMWKMAERDFTGLAEAVPEDKWRFKPTEGAFTDARTFAEQVKHVACGDEGWDKKLRGEQSPAHCDTGGPNPARTKAEILAYLRQLFDMMHREIQATRLGNLMDPVRGPYAGGNRFEVLTSALCHISDHMANWSSTRT